VAFRKTKLAVAVSGSLALAACGGGGGGTFNVIDPPPTGTEVNNSAPSTPTVTSYTDTDATTTSTSNGTATTTTTYADSTETSTDNNGNTVTEVWRTYTDTVTTPVTTTTTVTTTRTYNWSNGTTTSEVVNTTSLDSTADSVTTSTRRELLSRTVTPSAPTVTSYTDTNATTTSTSNGTATTTTTYADSTETSIDDNGSTVTEVWRTYLDTVTTPVTTTTTVTTTRTYNWSNGTTTSEVVNTTSSDSTANSVTTSTRRELLSRTVTPNVVSYSDSDATTTSTVVGAPTLTNTVVNTDTRDDGVWTFYYDTWTVTTTVTTTTTTTRTTLWTDGSTTREVTNTSTSTASSDSTYTTSRNKPPSVTTAPDPLPPTDIDGSTVIETYTKPVTLDYDPATYNAGAYYGADQSVMGTPTMQASNDPDNFATLEANNNAVLETHANYAYARGWTGEGSTVMIMDTGVDTDHPDLVDKIKYEWDPGYANGIEDTHGHGTHVAGIVAAEKDGTGSHGIAYDADLAIAKVGESNASLFFSRQALNWAKQYDDIVAANLSANSYSTYTNIVDQGNGIFTNDTDLDTALDVSAWASAMPDELVFTMSAGNASNEYSAAPTPIATAVDGNGDLLLDGRVLIVGNWNKTSSGIDGGKAGHVCRDWNGTTCDDPYKTSDFYILAPGISVYSTYNDGAYKTMSGTSMASPVVAGAVAIVHQMWPYMKGSNIAQLLLQTADKDLPNYSVVTHGQGLLDLEKATHPVGDLGISLTGRTGTTAPVSGTLSGTADVAALSAVSAVDDFDRDYTVDVSAAQVQREFGVRYAERQDEDGWSASFAGVNTASYDNFRAGTAGKNYSLGYTSPLAKNLDLTLSYTQSEESPWIDMTGMFGEVTGSTTVDATVKYKFSKQILAHVGLMSTKTAINPGMVTKVDDVQSAYAGVSYKEYMKNKDTVKVYAGVKPYALSGSVKLRVPTGVDANGVMQYEEIDSKVKTLMQGYAGVNYTNNIDENTSTSYTVGFDSVGDKAVGITFRHTFW
jgi:subtilisin family serine protease